MKGDEKLMEPAEKPPMPDESRTEETAEYPSGYDHVSEITIPLNDILHSGYTDYRVFEDWINMMLASLQGDEEAYHAAIEDYSREEIQKFAKAFGLLQRVTHEHNVDVLGDVYEALGMSSDAFAQHFTPHAPSEAMADMQAITATPSDDSPTTISDPTCGSGRLLIAASKRLEDGVFFGQDKDEICAKMTVINFCLFNIDGYVAYGDSLTIDVYRAWQTTETEYGGAIREIDADLLEERFKRIHMD